MKSLHILPLIFAATAFLSTGLSASEPINDQCPVSGEEVEAGKAVAVEVAFCCEKCKTKFDAAPADFLEKVSKAEEGKCPVSGRANDDDQKSTVTVGVCCGKCQTKMENNPKEFIGKVKAKKA